MFDKIRAAFQYRAGEQDAVKDARRKASILAGKRGVEKHHTEPLGNIVREHNYKTQAQILGQSGRPLTPAQQRRMRKTANKSTRKNGAP